MRPLQFPLLVAQLQLRPPVPTPVEVRAGTQLVVALATDVSTKTAKVEDRFEARLTSPLLSGDVRRPLGARVTGTITEVVSGSSQIVGGAAAGAVIGHQIEHGNKGKVIGGILGGAAGALVAKNTGSEVELQAGSQLSVVLEQGFVAPPDAEAILLVR